MNLKLLASIVRRCSTLLDIARHCSAGIVHDETINGMYGYGMGKLISELLISAVGRPLDKYTRTEKVIVALCENHGLKFERNVAVGNVSLD